MKREEFIEKITEMGIDCKRHIMYVDLVFKQAYAEGIYQDNEDWVIYSVDERNNLYEYYRGEENGAFDMFFSDLLVRLYEENYINISDPIEFLEVHFKQERGGISTELILNINGEHKILRGKGNGRLDAVSNALKEFMGISYNISTYEEHALQKGSNSQACAYVAITGDDDELYWGVGINDDIINASVLALISAVNRYNH